MALTAKLWSLSALAMELGKNVRTLGRALAMTPPDGKIGRHDAWYLQTALRALERHEGPPSSGIDAICGELESLAVQIDAALADMRKEPDVAKRRKLLERHGPLVGRLDEALRRSLRGRSEFMTEAVDRVIMGPLIGEILSVCEWRLAA
jgi:hypothetical protein